VVVGAAKVRRLACRRDPGEAAIVAALRKAGAFVHHLDGLGTPDLLCGYQGVWSVLEVKSPPGHRGGTSAKGQHLRPAQALFFAEAIQRGCPAFVVTTPETALEAIGVNVTTQGVRRV
jgi:hypothetical protein